ncbi:leucyl aminopeptidase [Candidatus Microgenomates bacterium]|nr:MAG: leucyl aminopeptidase [Candidatus Microgenomates bacterium]
MKTSVKSSKWTKIDAEAVVFFVSQDHWQKEIAEVGSVLGKHLIEFAEQDGFSAKLGEHYAIPANGKLPFRSIVLIGLGKQGEVTSDRLRKAAAQVARYAKTTKKKTVALELSNGIAAHIHAEVIGQAIAEGIHLGAYQFNKYQKNTPSSVLEKVFVLVNPAKLVNMVNGISYGEIFAEGTMYARDLVNEPARVITPSYLAAQAKQLVKSGIKVTILDKKEIAKLGMGAYLSVTQGSDEAPKFIKLEYRGGRRKIVLAGKAITFDTGGHSLKSSQGMETMKIDMAGGASVLGVFKALPKLKPKVTVIGLIAACENMVGPKATKPGDIVTAMNGKTIEVLNTDAEGRLTLADVLSYAVQEKPDAMVDLATLTGACVAALGEEIAGLFANNEDLAKKILTAGNETGEKIWQLPLERDYKPLLKSDIADLRNIAKSRYGGAITAALFLEEFVGNVPWVHIDIAGPSYWEKDTSLIARGASGFGVRTILNWLKDLQ